jgi:hypothetical protein
MAIMAGCAAPAGLPSGGADLATVEESPSPTSTMPSESPTPSLEPATEQPTILPDPGGSALTGHLGADSIEGGCSYLETDDGTRHEVIWPEGYEVDADGALLDAAGNVVAQPGDRLTVHGEEARDMASICQIGPIFRATHVQADS